jgi:hypothetical protein
MRSGRSDLQIRQHLTLAARIEAEDPAARAGRRIAVGLQPGPGVGHGLLDRAAAQPGRMRRRDVDVVQAGPLAGWREPDRELDRGGDACALDDVW